MGKEVNIPIEKLGKFVSEKGYYPYMYNPYNNTEIESLAPTLSTSCDRWDSSSTVMIVEMKDRTNKQVTDKMLKFADEHGYMPEMYQPYNNVEIKDISPSITTHAGQGGWDSSSTVMICEDVLLPKSNVAQCNKERTQMTEKVKVVGNYSPSEYNATSVVDSDGLSPTVRENHGQVTAVVDNDQTICLNPKGGRGGNPNAQPSLGDRIYDTKGIATAVTTCFMPSIAEPTDKLIQTATFTGYGLESSRRIYDKDGISPSLLTMGRGGLEPKVDTHLRIRKLTPKECFRLMGFEDKDYQACVDIGFGSSACYHVAGDSICTTVLCGLIGQMLMPEDELRERIQAYADSLAERKEL